jgi:hypothetical protein
MEKLPHYNFSWTVSKTLEEAMDLSQDRLILDTLMSVKVELAVQLDSKIFDTRGA